MGGANPDETADANYEENRYVETYRIFRYPPGMKKEKSPPDCRNTVTLYTSNKFGFERGYVSTL